jgi:hypothetical protein
MDVFAHATRHGTLNATVVERSREQSYGLRPFVGAGREFSRIFAAGPLLAAQMLLALGLHT